MKPALSYGPALSSGEWTDFWIYIAGPVIGATLGAFAYQLVRGIHEGATGDGLDELSV